MYFRFDPLQTYRIWNPRWSFFAQAATSGRPTSRSATYFSQEPPTVLLLT